MFPQFPDPPSKHLETFSLGQVEDHQRAQRIIIEGLIQRSESLLACCVPNLQDDVLCIDLHELLGELQSDCGIGADAEFVLDVSGNYVTFANARLACITGEVPTSTIFM
jgi:hypothetical protein